MPLAVHDTLIELVWTELKVEAALPGKAVSVEVDPSPVQGLAFPLWLKLRTRR
ncbi:MAG: hypothetical protein AAB502_11855 [Chloroflexota bacterium]